MNTPIVTGALTSSPQVFNVATRDCPFTVTLSSVNVSRKIRASSTGTGAATSFYDVTVDGTSTDAINAAIKSPITHIELTGTVGDIYRFQ